MKWYHFALLFFAFFFGLVVIEQQEEITEKLWEQCRSVEYDCLAAAVNAATEVFFEGKDSKKERLLLDDTEAAFFQVLSFLHDKNTDVSGREQQKEHCILLAVLDEDGYFFYCRQENGIYRWTEENRYEEDGRIPESFYKTIQKKINEYREVDVAGMPDLEVGSAMSGIWEKSLSAGCVLAVYSSEYTDHFKDRRKGILYAAAQKVTEEYPVTIDMVCHLPYCRNVIQQEIVAVFGSQKQAAKYGAAPCEVCLAWENEE